MLEAMKASGGESPNAGRIDRAVAQARADAERDLMAPAAVWKDPFAEDPNRAIPVRHPPRAGAPKQKELVTAKRQLARARAETAVAQAEAATAQADAARAKAAAAKAEASAAFAQAVAAKQEAVAARAACVDPSAGGASKRLVPARADGRPARARDALVKASLPRAARKPGPVVETLIPSPPPASAPAAPVMESTTIPLSDQAIVSSHPGKGILVVPITR